MRYIPILLVGYGGRHGDEHGGRHGGGHGCRPQRNKVVTTVTEVVTTVTKLVATVTEVVATATEVVVTIIEVVATITKVVAAITKEVATITKLFGAQTFSNLSLPRLGHLLSFASLFFLQKFGRFSNFTPSSHFKMFGYTNQAQRSRQKFL